MTPNIWEMMKPSFLAPKSKACEKKENARINLRAKMRAKEWRGRKKISPREGRSSNEILLLFSMAGVEDHNVVQHCGRGKKNAKMNFVGTPNLGKRVLNASSIKFTGIKTEEPAKQVWFLGLTLQYKPWSKEMFTSFQVVCRELGLGYLMAVIV